MYRPKFLVVLLWAVDCASVVSCGNVEQVLDHQLIKNFIENPNASPIKKHFHLVLSMEDSNFEPLPEKKYQFSVLKTS